MTNMSFIKGVHHMSVVTSNIGRVAEYFVNKLGFNFFAAKKDGLTHRCAVRSGRCIFVIRNADYYRPELTPCIALDDHTVIESVYDVALEVSNVKGCFRRVIENGGEPLLPPAVFIDYHGKIETAVVKSCLGNVIHTLIDSSDYKGLFLPGFTSPEPVVHHKNRNHLESTWNRTSEYFYKPHFSLNSSQNVTAFDHLAFASSCNTSDGILEWYRKCFNMQRIMVNKKETEKDGLMIEHSRNGMKLKAFDYSHNTLPGMTTEDAVFKFLVAEPLLNSVPNQITTFLANHGGPGLQHVGLAVNDIVSSIEQHKLRGVKFFTPPLSYFYEPEIRKEIDECGLNFHALRENGVLIDSEASTGEQHWYKCNKKGHLLQIFTQPLFERDTFFLELIERRGAKGFGARNIKALWKAVDSQLRESKNIT